jgi:hypothetical protein
MTLDQFTRAYIEAALWSSTDDDDVSLDKNYCLHNLAPSTLERMQADCAAFQEKYADLIWPDLSRAGHDFWLTRNGHGAGFWDGDWPADVGRIMTAGSKQFGEVWLYAGDDGQIYSS